MTPQNLLNASDQYAVQQGSELKGNAQWPFYLQGQSGRPVRVVLVSADPHLSHIICHELMGDPRTDVIGQGAGMREGRRLINSRETDVLIVDLHLPDGTGLQLMEYVKQTRPMIEVIVLSSSDDEEHALRAFRAGAQGFLIKHSWYSNYVQAVLQVVNGGAVMTPSVLRRVMRQMRMPASTDLPFDTLGSDGCALSEREKDVLRLLARGMTSSQAASKLDIGEQTVNTHVKNIYRKLNVKTRAQAVATASNFGVL